MMVGLDIYNRSDDFLWFSEFPAKQAGEDEKSLSDELQWLSFENDRQDSHYCFEHYVQCEKNLFQE